MSRSADRSARDARREASTSWTAWSRPTGSSRWVELFHAGSRPAAERQLRAMLGQLGGCELLTLPAGERPGEYPRQPKRGTPTPPSHKGLYR